MRRDNAKPERELTEPHRSLIALLQRLGYAVLAEYPVGRYKIDCYLPEFRVGVEVDGPGHSRKRDARRDAFLDDNYELPIIRFSHVLFPGSLDYVAKAVQEFVGDFTGSVDERAAAAKEYERMYGA